MLTKKQIISKKDFAKRITIYAAFCFLAIAISLAIGIFGYHYFGKLSWIDSFYNASMILTALARLALKLNLIDETALAESFTGPDSPEAPGPLAHGASLGFFDEWDVQALAVRLGAVTYPDAALALVPAESPYLWKIQAGGVTVGEVRRLALDAPVWAKPAFGIELNLGVMPSTMVAGKGANAHASAPARPRPAEPVRYVALPTTPAAEFDLALLVPDEVSAGQVEATLRSLSGAQLERCELFDEFRGTGVPEGTRSLAWRLTFRHPERTLRDKEIEGRRVQLLKALEAQLGVRPRTA